MKWVQIWGRADVKVSQLKASRRKEGEGEETKKSETIRQKWETTASRSFLYTFTQYLILTYVRTYL